MSDRYTYGNHIVVPMEEFGAAMNGILSEFQDVVRKAVNDGVRDVLKESAKEIRETGTYQNRRPKYRRSIGWRMSTKGFFTEGQVYAKDHEYSLTHLLENGHGLWNAPGRRTRAFKHWKFGEEWADEAIMKNIEKYLKF